MTRRIGQTGPVIIELYHECAAGVCLKCPLPECKHDSKEAMTAYQSFISGRAPWIKEVQEMLRQCPTRQFVSQVARRFGVDKRTADRWRKAIQQNRLASMKRRNQ